MPVLLRSDQSNADVDTSPRVGVKTVVGMVLGVLCLFVLVVSYQFLPRRRKPLPRTRILAPQPPPPTYFHRLCSNCSTFIRTCLRKGKPDTSRSAEQAPGTHGHLRTNIRSMHLPSERQRPPTRKKSRHKLSNKLHLNLSITLPRELIFTSSPQTTPLKPNYTRLGDGSETPAIPSPASLSPWSPSARPYPTVETPRSPLFRCDKAEGSGTPPPLYPPPPAYIPETPLRAGFNTPGSAQHDLPRGGICKDASPTSPTARSDGEQSDSMGSLMDEVNLSLDYSREWEMERRQEGVFVIADEDDGESDGDIASNDDNHSYLVS